MAKKYYVSVDGNDNWPGTEAQPFRTITKGSKTIAGGDTLYVKNGTYVEVVTINTAGTASNPITVMAYPGHKPVIDGRAGVDAINEGLPEGELKLINPKTGAGANFGGLFNINVSHVIVDGFEIKRSMGRGMRVFSSIDRTLEHVTVRNCNIHHSRQTNLLITGPRTAIGGYTCSHVTIVDSQLSWSGNYYPERRESDSNTDWSACIVAQAAEYCTIRRCGIFENWGEATIADANDGGSRKIIIEDCTYYDNMKGVYLHAVSDVLFQRNYIYQSATDKKRNNSFGQSNGVKVAPAEHEKFEQIPSSNIKILNNIFADLPSAITLAGTEIKEEIFNVLIAYNTVVNADIGISAKVFNKKNIEYRNNIVIGKSDQVLVDDAGGRTGTDWIYSNNLWSREPEALKGPNDVIGDPKLNNPSAIPEAGQGNPLNYTLSAGSPAENVAFLLSEPKEDFFKARRGSKPDIGFGELSPAVIKADFEANPIQGNAPISIIFQDRSSSSESITSWLWDFGDGTISAQQNPTHVYQDGTFSVSLRVTGDAGTDLITKEDFIVAGIPNAGNTPRTTNGLVSLYRFEEGGGQTLHDVSGEGIPLDLQIVEPDAVNWLNGSLAIISPTIIVSMGPAEKITEASRKTNEISIEVWLTPISVHQFGPARIVSISQDNQSSDVIVGQGLLNPQPSDFYNIDLRTTEQTSTGMASFSTAAGSLLTEKTHLVFTRNQSGTARIFIDGKPVAESSIPGDFSAWNPQSPLILANETNGNFPWLGDYHLLATYDRALSSEEVKQNFDAGTNQTNVGISGNVASLQSLKRFFIRSNSWPSNGSGSKIYSAFGVQYPDQRCVTCINDENQELLVHENLDAALRAFSTTKDSVTWIDAESVKSL